MLSVRQQCKILDLSCSDFYYKQRPKIYSIQQLELLRLVDEIYTKYPFFGTRQMSNYISAYHYELTIVRPCQVFSTDITYIRVQKGFVYLVAIVDWYSRFVLDWQLSITMESDFCVETLERVLEHSRYYLVVSLAIKDYNFAKSIFP